MLPSAWTEDDEEGVKVTLKVTVVKFPQVTNDSLATVRRLLHTHTHTQTKLIKLEIPRKNLTKFESEMM